MLKDISIGRYYKGDSLLHKLDPRLKTILFILFMVAIFMIESPEAILLLAVFTIFLQILGKIPPKVMWNTAKPVLPIFFLIFILNVLTIKEGRELFSWHRIVITTDGLKEAGIMSIRLLLMIFITSIILTLTTTPLKLSEALEKLMSPLKIIKFPAHEMAMTMMIALRFIPTLLDETDKIMKAQVSRGANYDTGSIISRLKGYITVLVPLFVSSFRRADELATAMDARCYNGGEGRTKLHPLHITGRDIFMFILLTLCAVSLVLIEKLL
ncbi:MAG: energy-coupling factor transporter transmembrane protein EcfT [Clostridiales bacterium]|nr:energy-coupling factor transporter transmembrane protein EcfT [Clostridiales bacterium]